MIKWKSIAGAGTLAALLSSTAAVADVSPREVWDNWLNRMTDFGYEVSATETDEGDTLAIRDIVMTVEMPEEDSTIRAALGSLLLKDQGDGTVSIDLPATMPIDIMTEVEGEKTDMQVTLSYTGPSVVASGSPEALNYVYSFANVTAELTRLLIDGAPSEDVDLTMSLDELKGTSEIEEGEMTKMVQKMTASALTYELSAQEPESGSFKMEADVQGINFEGSGTVPAMESTDDPAALLNDGFAFEGTFTQGPATMRIEGADNEGPFSADLASATSNLGVEFGIDGFDYSGQARDVTAMVLGGGVPLPINAEMSEVSYRIKMPLLKGEGQQDVAMELTLGGLTVSEMLWGMIDPSGVLPRDPATLSFDLAGKVTLFADLVDEATAEMDAPGELNSLNLKSMLLEIAGARLSGDGAFTFDNTDMSSFDGIPRPEGALNLKLKGANALIDNLVTMGLLPDDQAMAGRMMMGMFSVPVGEDDLESVIEINAEGHVLANGQRIQ